jgi:leucyl/phenylalanyl-tRNA--protein transferase
VLTPIARLSRTSLGFPSPEDAADEPNGLLAIGGDLSVARLVEAYSRGIFPWFDSDDGPILWWSPDPRGVVAPSAIKISRSLRQRLKRGTYRCTMDRAFTDVIDACAGARSYANGTWITPRMRDAYVRLFDAGFAHSVEAWDQEGLAGGLYGVSLGRFFFGESMFTRRTDASKVAFATLAAELDRWRFELIDCQMMNPHLATLGVRPMARSVFLSLLSHNRRHPTRRGRWQFDHILREGDEGRADA